MSIEILIVELVHQEIAGNCAIGEWDWQIRSRIAVPTHRELLIQSAQWCEDPTIANLFLLSALVAADNISIYQIDTCTDADYRRELLALVPWERSPLEIVHYFSALYSGDEAPDLDPQASPFYYHDTWEGDPWLGHPPS